MDKTTTEQMNDLVAQIVKEDGDHAALGIFASAISLATKMSEVASRVCDLVEDFDEEENAQDNDDEQEEG